MVGRAGLLLAAALALHAQSVFTVTSLADSGPGTLRDQLVASAQTPAPTINFAVSGVITVASPLALGNGRRNGLIIDGANQITISGGGSVRVFEVPGLIITTFKNLTIANGNADLGAGVRNNGYLTLKNVRMTNNRAVTGGGAIWGLDGILTIDSCTFDGNAADPDSGVGGAIFSSIASRMFVVNSTFHNNSADRGGAVLNDADEGLFYSTTISGNRASSGGGLFLGRFPYSAATYDLKNTIVSENTGGNCATSLPTPHFNDLGGNFSYPDNTCPGTVADPKLGPLADNGGPTPTMALLAGSPAIDSALDCRGFVIVYPETTPRPLTSDQRGVARPQGSACDSGAFEKSPIEFTGFFGPIANLPQVNFKNAGQAIPITFSAGSFVGMDVIAANYPASRPISCANGQVTGPLAEIDTPGKSSLSYDSFQNRYSINWKTEKAWEGQCRQLVVRLKDGSEHTAIFQFR